MMTERTRVLVAGGGPAGSMTAMLLAREGFDVIVCEKDRFPRYHIGESLLTSVIPLLELVGALERVERHGFVKKYGAFFRIKHDQPAGYIDFTKLSRYPHSFQVLRSEFDAILLDHARTCGASVLEQTAVTSVEFEDSRPVAATTRSADGSSRRISFDYMVDATGQAGLLSARYFRNRQEEVAFANVAMGGYFRGARAYRDRHGVQHPGAFSMEALSDGSGWTWAIPLHDRTLSVGVVVHRDVYKHRRKAAHSLEDYFAKTLELSPDVTSLIYEASREGEVRSWRDYSYFAKAFAGPGYRLAGDAAGFIDPLFSTGVHLAFDLIQPIVSGNADVNSDEIPPDLLDRALQFATATMLEAHDIRTNVPVAKLMSTRILDDSITDRFAAIDGMFIRFDRGQLGLERVGAIGSMLVGARNRIIRGVIAVAG